MRPFVEVTLMLTLLFAGLKGACMAGSYLASLQDKNNGTIISKEWFPDTFYKDSWGKGDKLRADGYIVRVRHESYYRDYYTTPEYWEAVEAGQPWRYDGTVMYPVDCITGDMPLQIELE